jgi:nucleoside phosphorylase/CheY-like chemotaxis protein
MPQILVIDDDSEKIRRILEVADRAGIVSEQIHVAYTAHDARCLIARETYDLVILDIALPERADTQAAPDTGIALMREICQRPAFNKPKQIVGLTAYTDVLASAGEAFQQELWYVIHYDQTSTEWMEQLGRKFRYVLLSVQNREALEYESDLCVIAALPTPEYSALLDIPWNWTLSQPHNEVTAFHAGFFQSGGTKRRVIAGCAPRTGMPAAAILATKMICNFRPRFLAMIGIAAGVRGACNLGDILIADPTWDYGSGRWSMNDGEPIFEIAPHQIQIQAGIRSRLQLMAQDAATLSGIRESWRARKPDSALKMVMGPVASGAAVRTDGRVVADVKAQHRKTIGIEMEAYGVMAAAYDAPLPEVHGFVLKSVSDFADQTKSDDYQAYAAYISASALRVFAERFLP